MLNPQLQFHLESFSSENAIEGEPEPGPLKDDKLYSRIVVEQKAASSSHYHPGSYASLSFIAGLIARPASDWFCLKVLLFCSCFAASIAALNVVNTRKLAARWSTLKETRESISRVLCRIGAPPLDAATDPQIIPSSQQLHGLAVMTSHISEWIQTVDRVLGFIQASTSIHLGLGPNSVSVGRLELASLRKQNGKLSRIALSSLRRRLLGKMIQINRLLLQVCDEGSICVEDDLDSTVVTLLVLKRERQETASNISRLLNHFFASPLPDCSVEKMESLCLVVSEARAYFSGIFDPEDVTFHNGVESQLLDHIQSILIDVQGLQTCLQASYETAGSECEQCDLQDFWDETKTFLEKIQTAVEALPVASAAFHNDASILTSIDPSNEYIQSKSFDIYKSQEFVTEVGSGDQPAALVLRGQPADSTKTNKVLIFSGRGEVQIRIQKREMYLPRAKDERCYDGCRYQESENKLLAELQKHLNSLPKRIEENVCLESPDDILGHEGSTNSHVSVSSEKDESADDIFSRRVLDGDFLAELTKQIPTVAADNNEHSFE